jgi:hypothetical protein
MVNAMSRGAHVGALLVGLVCWAKPVMAQDDSDQDWFPDTDGELVTAFSSLRRCATDDECEARFGTATSPTVDRQLVIPAGGLRYVHYYAIHSEWNRLGRRRMFQAYAHALVKPVNAGDPRVHFVSGIAGGQPVGGRVGVEAHSGSCPAQVLLGTGCATWHLALGFAPYPEYLLLEFHVGYPVFP